MKRLVLMGLLFLAVSVSAKETGDSVASPVKLKQYYFVLLTKGTNRTQDPATAEKIQKAHLENIGRLSKEGKLVVAGPFGDDGNWRGIFIFDMASQEAVEKELQTDMAIASGRLAYEIHPWYTIPGAVFK